MSDVAALPDSSVARFEVADRHLRKAIGLNSLLRVDRRHHRIGLDFPTVAAASAAGPASAVAAGHRSAFTGWEMGWAYLCSAVSSGRSRRPW